jgi:hypothetical protein
MNTITKVIASIAFLAALAAPAAARIDNEDHASAYPQFNSSQARDVLVNRPNQR